MNRSFVPVLFFVVALVLAWPRLQPLPAPNFVLTPTAASRPDAAGNAKSPFLPRFGATAHAVTLARADNGKVIAAWFSGSREGAQDVAIVSSTLSEGVWSTPRVVVDPAIVERDSLRIVRKVGNPLLWRDEQNVLHLWFVSVSYGGWAGSAINHMESIDNGIRWSKCERIVVSPFWNLSTLVRNPPIALLDGGVAVPAYHEFLNKRPEWLRFDAHMMLVDRVRVPDSARMLQPAVTPFGSQEAIMVLRDAGEAHRIQSSRTSNGGAVWQPTSATSIDNPNSAIAMIRLHDGSLLLACNPQASNRNRLAVLRSTDQGDHWSEPHVIEQGDENDEFSYPALLQDDAGEVHLAYTWKRQTIKHMIVSRDIIMGLR